MCHCLIGCPRYVNERNGCGPERLRIRPSMCEEGIFRMLGTHCFRVQMEHKTFYKPDCLEKHIDERMK